MPVQLGLPLEGRGEAPRVQRSGEAPTMASGTERLGADHLMERVRAFHDPGLLRKPSEIHALGQRNRDVRVLRGIQIAKSDPQRSLSGGRSSRPMRT